jgi:flagellar M-ring protein FliF
MQEMLSQIGRAWSSLTLSQRTTLVVSTLLTIAAVGGIVWWAQRPSWTVLYTGLDPKDAQGVIGELQSRGVPHRLGGGGSAIEVPAESVHRLRMELAAQDMPSTGRFGYVDMFNQESMSQSTRMQRMRQQKAMEDEIARSIESLRTVRSARVHLVLPGDRVFLDDEEPAKASVVVDLQAGSRLAPDEVQAVVRLVAGSVSELDAANVNVVDTTGRLLWGGDADDQLYASSRQLELKTSLERSLNAKAARVLERVIGASRYQVESTVDLDMDKVLRREQSYDPDSAVLISEEKLKEETSGGGGVGGVPGTAANLPNGLAGAEVGGGESSSRSEKTSNFQYSSIERTIEEPYGKVERVSVAVVVDQEWDEADGGERTAVPRSDDELGRIEELVKAAISFDETRGDVVTVRQTPFPQQPELEVTQTFDPWRWLPLVKYPTLVLLALLAFLLFVRPALRTAREAVARSATAPPARARATAEVEGQPQLGPPSQLERLRQRLTALADEEPEGMAQTMRVWLHDTPRSR